MKFTMTIGPTFNAAFEDDPDELPRIIRDTAEGHLRDVNGNRVGSFTYTPNKESTP
jgi:hypothetical protein